MKKLLALFLALTMIFALCACVPTVCEHADEDGNGICDKCEKELETVCDNHVDENEDGICDNCDEELPCEHADEENDGVCDKCGATVERTPPALTGIVLTNAVIEQLEKAASLEIKITGTIKDESSHYYMWDEVPEHYEYKSERNVTITATVSRDADGNVAFKLIGEAKFYELSDDEIVENPEFETEVAELYFVDNVMYIYDEGLDVYLETSYEEDFAELGMAAETLAAMLEGVTLTEEETAELLTAIGDSVIAALDIKSGKGSVSVDLADDINEIFAFFAQIDTATDTPAAILDEALALVDEELTTEALLTALEEVANLTISEALEAIDSWLTEEYDTTLQGVYDTIVADERFAAFFANVYLQSDPEATEEDLEDAFTYIKAFDIAAVLVSEELDDVVLYDFILMATGAAEDSPTCEELFDMVGAMLAMTFDDLSENMGMEFGFEQLAGIEILQLKAGYEVEFSPFFEIVKVDGSFVVEVETEQDCGFEGYDYTDTSYSYLSIAYSITNISTNSVEVTAPTEDVYVDFLGTDFEYVDEYASYYLYFDHYIYEIDDEEIEEFGMCINVVADILGEYVYYGIYADDLSLDMFDGDTVTIPAENLYSDSEDFEATQDLILVIDPANESFVIEQWCVAEAE